MLFEAAGGHGSAAGSGGHVKPLTAGARASTQPRGEPTEPTRVRSRSRSSPATPAFSASSGARQPLRQFPVTVIPPNLLLQVDWRQSLPNLSTISTFSCFPPSTRISNKNVTRRSLLSTIQISLPIYPLRWRFDCAGRSAVLNSSQKTSSSRNRRCYSPSPSWTCPFRPSPRRVALNSTSAWTTVFGSHSAQRSPGKTPLAEAFLRPLEISSRQIHLCLCSVTRAVAITAPLISSPEKRRAAREVLWWSTMNPHH